MSDSYAHEGRKKKAKELANQRYEEAGLGKPSRKQKKKFHIEYRYKEEQWFKIQHDANYSWMYRKDNNWRKYRSYVLEHSRNQALAVLSSKDDYWSKYYEFRLTEG